MVGRNHVIPLGCRNLWAVHALQINVLDHGKHAPNLVSALNITAFNVGNALGAWVGGMVIAGGLGLAIVPVAAAGLAVIGLISCMMTFNGATSQK